MSVAPLRRPWRTDSTLEAAASWALLHENGELSEANQRRFADWLAENAAHIAAYEDALWALDTVARHAGEPEMLVLRGEALAARGIPRRARRAIGGIAAAAASIALVAGLWITWLERAPFSDNRDQVAESSLAPRPANYRTAIGERSVLRLPDDSIATLDTDTEIHVAYTETERAVHLLRGQALFEVAHGQAKPFLVYAGDQQITAIGTTFNVRIEGEEVRVSMVEGSVRVRSNVAREPQLAPVSVLETGEGLVATPDRQMIVKRLGERDVAAWTGGKLVFNDVPLSQAVAEINRYTENPIAISDATVGTYRISGVFNSNDPQRFANAISEIFPVRVKRSSDGAITLRAETR